VVVDEKALNGFVGRECPAVGFRAAVCHRGPVKGKRTRRETQPSADYGLGIRALQPRGIALHGSSIKMRPWRQKTIRAHSCAFVAKIFSALFPFPFPRIGFNSSPTS